MAEVSQQQNFIKTWMVRENHRYIATDGKIREQMMPCNVVWIVMILYMENNAKKILISTEQKVRNRNDRLYNNIPINIYSINGDVYKN